MGSILDWHPVDPNPYPDCRECVWLITGKLKQLPSQQLFILSGGQRTSVVSVGRQDTGGVSSWRRVAVNTQEVGEKWTTSSHDPRPCWQCSWTSRWFPFVKDEQLITFCWLGLRSSPSLRNKIRGQRSQHHGMKQFLYSFVKLHKLCLKHWETRRICCCQLLQV